MACCLEGSTCPMHGDDSDAAGTNRALTQAQADTCCASSEQQSSNQSTPTGTAAISNAVLGTSIVLPPSVPALVLTDAWRTDAPIPTTLVPKHILLSVFLV